MKSSALITAARFFSFADTATNNGGFYVSAAGGTALVAADIISRYTGCSFDDASGALDIMGRAIYGSDWYCDLWANQPNIDADFFRWDVRTIARAACASTRSDLIINVKKRATVHSVQVDVAFS